MGGGMCILKKIHISQSYNLITSSQMGFSQVYIIVSVNQKKDKTPEEMISLLENSKGRVILEIVAPNGQKSFTQFYFY